jgi:phosphoglycolate phosphatase
MLKLIIFDWDDVITLGAKEAYFALYHRALMDVGVHLSLEEERVRILAKWGKPYQEVIKSLLSEHPDFVNKAVEIYETKKSEVFLNTLRIIPGTQQLLSELSKKYKLAVSSGNSLEMIRDRIIPFFQIPNVFSQIVSSHDIKDQSKTKPHAFMLEVILSQQKIEPEEAIYVGDAVTDVQMAGNANVTAVVVLTGHLSKKVAEGLKVQWIIPDITHLPNILDNL